MGCCESKPLEKHSNDHTVRPDRQAMVSDLSPPSFELRRAPTPEDHILFAAEVDRPSTMDPLDEEAKLDALEKSGDGTWIRGATDSGDSIQPSSLLTSLESNATGGLVSVTKGKMPDLLRKHCPSMSATSDVTVCLLEQRPSIACASERTVCIVNPEVRLSMTANSACLSEQRASLSAQSQRTVCCLEKRSSLQATDMHSDLTICIGRPSMREHREKTIFITEADHLNYDDTDMHSEITVCLNGQRVSLSAASETTVHHRRPSLSCNSDQTVNVRKFSMARNSNLTINLGSQRVSLSCNSDQTVNVRKDSMARNSNLTICLDSQRPSLSCNSDCTVNVRKPSMSRNSNLTICLGSQRASLSCNSDCTVNVRQPSMARNSNLTICLGSQRASLSCNSDCTVNVCQPRLSCNSNCTVNVKKFSMSCNSEATVCIPQEWDLLRKTSDGIVCYDERLSLRTCASIELSENKDLSDEQVGVIDKILLNLAPEGYAENRQRMSHYNSGAGTLTHRRKTYCPSSLSKDHLHQVDAHRKRFASTRSMSPTLAREMAMRLVSSEHAKGWTVADLLTPRNLFKISPLIILFAMLLPYLHVDLHQCPLEDECFHCTFHFGEDAGENEIEELKRDWMC